MHALTLCNQYVIELTKEEQLLKQQVSNLNNENNQLVSQIKHDDHPTLIPGWVLFVGGVVVGGIATTLIVHH